MAVQNQADETTNDRPLSRTVDTPDFIVQLAEDMRLKSGSDLPLSCFIQQVRMQLSGMSPGDVARMTTERPARQTPLPKYQTSDCFKAWAMPD